MSAADLLKIRDPATYSPAELRSALAWARYELNGSLTDGGRDEVEGWKAALDAEYARRQAVARIRELENRAGPGVMVWDPQVSVSGLWEALGGDWLIEEADPVVFADKLEARLPRPQTSRRPSS